MNVFSPLARTRGTAPATTAPSSLARTTVAGIALAGVAFTAACGTGPEEEAQEEYVPARSLTMAFGGDVMFESHLRSLAYDEDSLSELQSTLGAADLSVVNVETALTEGGTPWPGKPFTFRAPASALDAVAGAGVDAVTMANNHAFDYGDEGAEDTFDAKEASPIPVVGIGRDEDEAYAPATLEANGVKVAVIGASQVYEETLANRSAGPDKAGIAASAPDERMDRLVEEVKKAEKSHDVVVAMMHWGIEGQHCPGDAAIDASRTLEKAGADVIIGDHAHRVNGHGWLGDSYVHYGTGNFVYYLNYDTAGHTGVLTVTIDVPASDEEADGPLVSDAEWTPMLIGYDGIPRPAAEVAGEATADQLTSLTEGYRECTPASATRDGAAVATSGSTSATGDAGTS